MAGWIHSRQLEAIDYLRAENRVLRHQLAVQLAGADLAGDRAPHARHADHRLHIATEISLGRFREPAACMPGSGRWNPRCDPTCARDGKVTALRGRDKSNCSPSEGTDGASSARLPAFA
jgi:hypothetical protein